ncbi:MAG: biopolymer transporter ExbD [Deltaproteobacteria bacterium]|nr:biopolymer transporter ExbD [Deltaproteobacteria bacterium]
MAGGMDLGTGGKGTKKPLDATVNLVPFIDLMAVTISFLIMTAVWNQIGRLPVAQGGGSDPIDETRTTGPRVELRVLVTANGISVSVGSAVTEIPKVDGRYTLCRVKGAPRPGSACEERSLVEVLRRIKATVPEQRDLILQVEDTIRYSDLVEVVDACNLKDDHGQPLLFPEVSVSAIG